MKKGYLIPQNAQPTANRCLRVFVPDDPLYIAAFLGALTYFGQWTAWERDKEKRGQFAAHAWREANELTLDGLPVPCSDNPITDEEMSEILEQLADIQTQLAEINEMNVTQTVNVGGGCGCCDGESTATQTTSGIIIDPEDTGIIPPYMTENVTVVDSARCRAANWMAVTVAQMTRTMSTIGTMPITLSNVVNVLIAIFTVGNGVIWSMTAILALGYRLINGLNSDSYDYFDTVADAMGNSMQSFVCALYNWTSADNLGAMLNGAILGFVNDAKLQLSLSDTVADSMYTALADVMGAAFVNYFVENIDTIVPADFVAQYDCLCGATGDSCPTSNLVLAGVGTLPSGDLTGTSQGFGSSYNSQTGFYEIIFELAANYCVTIDNVTYTPTEEHEKCSGGVMVPSDGSCVRRFVARSQTQFATAVTFDGISDGCYCQQNMDEYALKLMNGTAVDWATMDAIESGKVYTIRGSGLAVTLWRTAAARFRIVKVGGGYGSAIVEIVSITPITLMDDAATEAEHSFWNSTNDETCSIDWGYDTFIPAAGFITPYMSIIDMRGKENIEYEVAFRILSVRDRQCP